MCDHYPDHCQDEAWFIREMSQQLEEKFGQNRTFTFAFMDSFSQSGPNNINDEVQQVHWKEETGKLWQEATTKNQTFNFLTVDDVQEEMDDLQSENDDLQTEIEYLHDIIDFLITTLGVEKVVIETSSDGCNQCQLNINIYNP